MADVSEHLEHWRRQLAAREIPEEIKARGAEPTDPGQLAFELYAPLELANYLCTLHRDPSITERGRHAVRDTIARATPHDHDRPTTTEASAGN